MKQFSILSVLFLLPSSATADDEPSCRGLCPTADCSRLGDFRVDVARSRAENLGDAAPESAAAFQRPGTAGKSAKGSAVRTLTESARVADAKAPAKACGTTEDGTRIACSVGDEAFSDVAASSPMRNCRQAAPAPQSRFTDSAPSRNGLDAKESSQKIAPEAL